MSENELKDEETPLAPEASSENEDESPDVEGHIHVHHDIAKASGHVAGAEGHVA